LLEKPLLETMFTTELTVLGIGNILMSDEGVGVRLMEAVRDGRRWPSGVEFIDGGAGGLGLLNVIESARRLVVFDAAEMQLPPGQCRVITPEQISDEPADHSASMHDVPFMETVGLCKQFGRSPELIRLLVVQPQTIQFGRQLSEVIRGLFTSLVSKADELVRQTAAEAGLRL